ncbi:bacteriocin [uncultured Flavobacterium sp.]
MKNKEVKTTSLEKTIKIKSLKSLSKKQLETIIGGPEVSRGTKVDVTP